MARQPDLKIAMGDIERKVDMSLDDIIKQSRNTVKKQHHPKVFEQIKYENSSLAPRLQIAQGKQRQNRQTRELQKRREVNQGRVLNQRRDMLQRFVALRSSALRQGKLAESRSKNNNFQFTTVKAAARQALSASAGPPLARWSRQPMQRTAGSSGLVTQRQKILGVNQLSKTGVARRLVGRQPGLSGKGVLVQPPQRQMQTWGSNNISTSGGPSRKPQTLDSRFASLREERQLQLQLGPHAGRRR